jgi:hypothetical protein
MDLDEAQMDQLLELKQTELKQYLYDNSPWAYVNYEDIKRLDMMQGQTIFAIRAQPGTKLEVPDPDIVCAFVCKANVSREVQTRGVMKCSSAGNIQ